MPNCCHGNAKLAQKRQRSGDIVQGSSYSTRCSKRSRLNEHVYCCTKTEKITECPKIETITETECPKVDLCSEDLIKQTLLSLNSIFTKPVRVSWSTVDHDEHPLHNVTLVTSPEHDDESDIQEELEDLLEAWERSRVVLREE